MQKKFFAFLTPVMFAAFFFSMSTKVEAADPPDLIVGNSQILREGVTIVSGATPNGEVRVGIPHTLRFTAKNNGLGTANAPIRIRALVDNVIICTKDITTSLAPGAVSAFQFCDYNFPNQSWPQELKVIVDPANTIAESNETNNVSTRLLNTVYPTTQVKKVYLINYDPIESGSTTLAQHMTWNQSGQTVWDKINKTIDFFKRTDVTGGKIVYDVVNPTNYTKNEFPPFVNQNGAAGSTVTYTTVADWEACYQSNGTSASCLKNNTTGKLLPGDWNKIIRDNDVCGRLNRGEIDEFWVYGAPFFELGETYMAGPHAFNPNNGIIEGTTCKTLLPIMSFSYKESFDQNIHDFGHRLEGTMNKVYGAQQDDGINTDWSRFKLLDAHGANYNYSGCGWVHYTPNTRVINPTDEYGYNIIDPSNPKYSMCDDFYNYPNLTAPANIPSILEYVDCNTWWLPSRAYIRPLTPTDPCPPTRTAPDQGDAALAFYKWWFNHVPRYSGTNPTDNTKLNDWLEYMINPTLALTPQEQSEKPDLIIENIYITSTSGTVPYMVKGGSYTIRSIIKNIGTYPVTHPAMEQDDIQINGVTLCYNGNDVRLDPGQTFERVCMYTAPATPTFLTIAARADYDNTIIESSETNNTKAITVEVKDTKPDLVIDRIYVTDAQTGASPGQLIVGKNYNIHSWVKNIGTVAAPVANTFSDDILINGNPIPSCPGQNPIALNPGQEYERNCLYTANLVGTLTFTGRADFNGAVSELSETNNSKDTPIQSVDIRPDLLVSSVYVTEGSATVNVLKVGTQYTIHSVVKNIAPGSANVPQNSFQDNIIVNGTIHCFNTNPIAMLNNSQYERTCLYTPTAEGTVTITGNADTNSNQVIERNETNNSSTPLVLSAVIKPDFIISDLYITDLNNVIVNTFNTTSQYRIHSWVKNIGNGTANANTFTDNIKVYGAQLCFGTNPVSLATNQAYERVCLFTPTVAGATAISAQADVNLQINELDENNNIVSEPINITETRSDLIINSIYVTEVGQTTAINTIKTGTTYRIHSKVKNLGPATISAGSFSDEIVMNGTQLCFNTNSIALAAGQEYDRDCGFTPTTAGSITFTGRADFNGQIIEVNETNNTNSVTVSALTKPDLVIDRIYVTDLSNNPIGTLLVGTQYRIHSWVRNIGNGTANAGTFSDDIVVAGTQLCFNTNSTIAPNQEYDRSCTFTPQSETVLTITGKADINSQIDEFDNNNNSKSMSIAVDDQRPDLTVISITVYDNATGAVANSMSVGVQYKIRSVIKNIGVNSVASNSFNDEIRIDATQLCFAGNPTALATNQQYNRDCLYTPTAMGNITIRANADYNLNIGEPNDNNNSLSTVMSIYNRPDLIIDNLYVTSNATGQVVSVMQVGQSYTIHSIVKNIGTTSVSAGVFDDRIIVNGTTLCFNTNPAMAVNATYDRFCGYTPGTSGSKTIDGQADYSSELTEAREYNNTDSISVGAF